MSNCRNACDKVTEERIQDRETADGKMSRGTICLKLALLIAAWTLIYRGLKPAADYLAFETLGLSAQSHLGGSVAFFIFEVPKVLMLLVLVVFAIGIVRSFFTPEKTRTLLSGRNESGGNVLAAGLGVVTPFCSCSAVPLFIGFVEAGIPLGVTFSFLIAAPMVNEVALALLLSMFGWRIAALYLGTGLAIAILAGWIIGRLRMERFVEDWVYDVKSASGSSVSALTWDGRIRYGFEAVREIVGKVWPYVVAGIAIGAGIHGYIPEGMMASFMGKDVWWGVPAAVLLGVPMYSNAAGIIPIIQALMEKGASMGTALAFMMAVIGLSLPETIILRKVLRPPLIGAFVGVVAAGILMVGYLFNILL